MKEASYHLTLLAQNRTGFQEPDQAGLGGVSGRLLLQAADRQGTARGAQRGDHLPERLRVGRVQPRACCSGTATEPDLDEALEIAAWFHQRVRRPLLHRDSEQRRSRSSGWRWKGRSRWPAAWACRWWPRATPTTSTARMPTPRTCCCASTRASSAPTPTGCGWKATSSISAAPEEMYAAFPGLEDAVARSQQIADTRRHRPGTGQAALSRLSTAAGEDGRATICASCASQGLKERYADEPEHVPRRRAVAESCSSGSTASWT